MRARSETMVILLTNNSAYTPQPNGLVGRMNRTLPDKTRSMLEHGGLPIVYQGNAIKHATDFHDRTVTKALNMRTPMEALLGTNLVY